MPWVTTPLSRSATGVRICIQSFNLGFSRYFFWSHGSPGKSPSLSVTHVPHLWCSSYGFHPLCKRWEGFIARVSHRARKNVLKKCCDSSTAQRCAKISEMLWLTRGVKIIHLLFKTLYLTEFSAPKDSGTSKTQAFFFSGPSREGIFYITSPGSFLENHQLLLNWW